MALAAVQTAMNLEKQTIHSFFSKPHTTNAPEQQPPTTATPQENAHDDPDYEQPEKARNGQKKRGRKPGSTNKKKDSPTGKNQSLMDKFTKPSRGLASAEDASGHSAHISGEPTLEDDANQNRRKRRKTDSPEPAQTCLVAPEDPPSELPDWHHQLRLEAGEVVAPGSVQELPQTCSNNVAVDVPLNRAAESPRPVTPPNVDIVESSTGAQPGSISASAAGTITPKKKTIKAGKNGKLLSSPPKAEPDSMTPKKRRARKPKVAVVPTITIIKYGHSPASRRSCGEKIDAILRGDTVAPRPATPKKAPPKPVGPPKPTHPFFLGKPAPKSNEPTVSKPSTDNPPLPSPRGQKKSAVTPGKLKMESRAFHSATDMPAFGLTGSNRAPRQGGLADAPWPMKGTAHVRNLDATLPPDPLDTSREPPLKARKMKSNIRPVPEEEDIVAHLASQLRLSMRYQHNLPQVQFTPPKDVRLPTRLLTTGVNIQEEMRSQIISLSTSREDSTKPRSAHPAVTSLFASIEHDLTPFDLNKCEPLSWVQKYAPKYASHVLQPGKEPAVLKDWLQSLTVLAVGGQQNASKAAEAADSRKPPKKKRKKTQDDFIVDSDEEEEEDMIELPSEETENGQSAFHVAASLRRARWTRNKNVVLISGPHGCGKSAMVHAVAKDLGFEIFEINSGSRRSGKDVQDKVGDMSENHLVNHKQKEAEPVSETVPTDGVDFERHSDAFQKDLDSGRQGTMMSFFKSKCPEKEKSKSKPPAPERRKPPSSGQATLLIAQSQRKSQKQSLILFEEADILYEEDQGFWAQLVKLASLSKRPIVITCTNEALVPMHDLPLAAILRLSPPPVHLATDYMVALAGHEGHVLERDAVSTLYQSKNCDLRASITELNFWCQMSVGDRKGGLDWIYQRWPPGKDLDESGRPLRVVSKGTYTKGMGCLSHTMFQSQGKVGFDPTEEMLKESWEEWGVSPHQWTGGRNAGCSPEVPGRGTVDDLKHLDGLTESISAADTYCRIDMPSYEGDFEQPTDPSLPQLPDKTRLSYTIFAPVMQVDHVTDHSHVDTDMYNQSHLLIRRVYGNLHATGADGDMPLPTTEEGFIDAILQHKNRQNCKSRLSWPDFSQAFDILGYPPDTLPALNTSYNLTASSFDRTLKIVVEDLAPYVRSIIASELVLENRRIRLGNLLSEGGSRSTKRQRTTRAARTALEGGSRDTKRRERWFDKDLNRALVMGTAGKSWAGLGSAPEGADAEAESKTEENVADTQEE